MPQYSLHINGKLQTVIAEPDTPLLWILRDELNLTGTKYGCGVGVCGACTVHENGAAVRACQIAISSAADKRFTTIEGLSPAASIHAKRHGLRKMWPNAVSASRA